MTHLLAFAFSDQKTSFDLPFPRSHGRVSQVRTRAEGAFFLNCRLPTCVVPWAAERMNVRVRRERLELGPRPTWVWVVAAAVGGQHSGIGIIKGEEAGGGSLDSCAAAERAWGCVRAGGEGDTDTPHLHNLLSMSIYHYHTYHYCTTALLYYHARSSPRAHYFLL